MAETSFRKVLSLNQQTYQRLKQSLSLNLRRQMFIAVCDDLILRDRMVAQLQAELAQQALQQSPELASIPEIRQYPRLVSLHLNLSDPNPIVQVAQWLSHSPPPKVDGIRAAMPAFQILGIEHLTRQPATVQRQFLAHLQAIERSLPVLESSLLFWMPQPWCRTLAQSAPEFWRCRTAVFEFIGDPTPLMAMPRPIEPARSLRVIEQETIVPHNEPPLLPPAEPAIHQDPQDSLPEPATDRPSDIDEKLAAQDQVWNALEEDLARLEEAEPQDLPPLDADARLLTQTAAQLTLPFVQVVDTSPETEVTIEVEPPLIPVYPPDRAFELDEDSIFDASLLDDDDPDRPSWGVSPRTFAPVVAYGGYDEPVESHPEQSAVSSAVLTLPDRHPLMDEETESDIEFEEEFVAEDRVEPELEPSKADLSRPAPSLEAPLLEHIERLHQLQVPPSVLADAYRTLGNQYRDRIEQGEATEDNLAIAINAYEQVLVWLHETSALWTDVLNDLGNLYWMQSRLEVNPDLALDRLRQAIQAYQLALNKVTNQTQTGAYPMIQNNLGAAYADLARYLDPIENLQRSILAYQQALRYRTPESDPQRYASTQNNLGTTYWTLAQHQQSALYLKQAIAAYSEALRYYNPQEEPLNYAMIQNNLGTAYWNLAQHERPQDWLRLAIASYQMALQHRTVEAAPVAHAATQNNLGTAFWHMASHLKDDPHLRLDYLLQAISAYEATLLTAQLLTHGNGFPVLNFDLFATHNNLGLAHYQIATDPKIPQDTAEQSAHLEVALDHHLQAIQGWQSKADFRQTALTCILQTIRALYTHCGLQGQNTALSRLPGYLLPEVLPQL